MYDNFLDISRPSQPMLRVSQVNQTLRVAVSDVAAPSILRDLDDRRWSRRGSLGNWQRKASSIARQWFVGSWCAEGQALEGINRDGNRNSRTWTVCKGKGSKSDGTRMINMYWERKEAHCMVE